MAKLTVIPDVSQVKGLEELKKFTAMNFKTIVNEINGRLNFVQNVEAAGPYEVEFLNGTDVVNVKHSLGRVPAGFLVISLDSGIVVFKPATSVWTSLQIQLQATAAGIAQIYVV